MPEGNKLTLVSGMAMLLQSCDKEEELFDTIAYWYLPLLFKGCSGAIYLAEDKNESLKRRLAWGKISLGDQITDECPALQSGIPINQCSVSSILCAPSGEKMYCIPLRESTKVFGMLCLKAEKGLVEDRGIAFITAECLTLAIANLRLRKRLYQMALRDELTNLYNRRHMNEVLANEIHRAKRQQTSVGVVMFDLDYLKRINDKFGHAAGDWVLKSLAAKLMSVVRKEDIVCRMGGDEFLILLTGGNLKDYKRRAEHIRNEIAEMQLSWNDHQISPITASIGVASFPEHARSRESLLHQADLALYKAKSSGRNQVLSAANGKGVNDNVEL